MSTTSIEWVRNRDGSAGDTLNSVTGCTPVSRGCDNCYPIPLARRWENHPHPAVAAAYEGLTIIGENGKRTWSGRVNTNVVRAKEPLRRQKPTTYFVPSMGDLFHGDVPTEFIALQLAVFAVRPQHTMIVTTKRPGRMRSLLTNPDFKHLVATKMVDLSIRAGEPTSRRPIVPWPLPNVRLGVSVEDQATALLRIPLLLGTPAAVHWVSAEPLLGPIQLWDPEPCDHVRYTCIEIGCWRALAWVVTGGESGNGARAPHPDWFRSLRDQAVTARIPFFFKQWGIWSPRRPSDPRGAVSLVTHEGERFSSPLPEMTDPSWARMYRVGKKAAGHELDGQLWQQFPGFGAW